MAARLTTRMGEPRFGRVRNGFLLEGGILHHALEVLALDSPGPVCRRTALLRERRDLTQPLAPARQRRTIERRPMLEHNFHADALEIRVLHPPFAQGLIGEVVQVLEGEQAGH